MYAAYKGQQRGADESKKCENRKSKETEWSYKNLLLLQYVNRTMQEKRITKFICPVERERMLLGTWELIRQ